MNAYGAFLSAKEVAPDMIAKGRGSMLFTGATAGVKAGARSVAFGPAKFALRGLVQSMARDLGPKGIHVAWINVDGVIDIPGRDIPGFKEEDMLKPEAIAETYWHLAPPGCQLLDNRAGGTAVSRRSSETHRIGTVPPAGRAQCSLGPTLGDRSERTVR